MATGAIQIITVGMEARRQLAWPHFAGSTIRGAFGRALRMATCVTGQKTCQGCPVRFHCAYGTLFDPAVPQHPLHPSFRDGIPLYLIRPPTLGAATLQTGHLLQFKLVLLPGSESHIGLMDSVLKATVEKELVTPGAFKMVGVSRDETVLPVATNIEDPNTQSARVTLRWRTPLRIQQNGNPIFKACDFDCMVLIRALLRRQLQWSQISRLKPVESEQYLNIAKLCHLSTRNMAWHDMARHSDIQKRRIPLGGLIGSAELTGPHNALLQLLPLLQISETLHLGKEAVMGLGQFTVGAVEA